MEWDGKERRGNTEDHDILIRLDANVSNLIDLVEHHRKDFKSHMDKDDLNFQAVSTEMQNITDKCESNQKLVMNIILPAMGGFSVLMFLITYFHK